MIIDKILNAVENEYDEHKDCNYNIECVLNSKSLIEKLNKILIEEKKNWMKEFKKKSFYCVCQGKHGTEIK